LLLNLAAGVYLGAAVLIGLVVLRQVFALLEIGRLYSLLQHTYRQVEQTNSELVRSQQELAEARDQAVEASRAKSAFGAAGPALVVDDDAVQRRMLRTILENDGVTVVEEEVQREGDCLQSARRSGPARLW
jgi:PleD family two-component response regulator